MNFTIHNIIGGISVLFMMAILIVVPNILFNNCDPKVVDDVKVCNTVVANSAILGWIIGVAGMIGVVFIPFFQSLKPKDIRDQLQDERGPTHGTLPKGFKKDENGDSNL